jgi:signal transduction histidine kinase
MDTHAIDSTRLERLLEVGRGLVSSRDPEVVLTEVLRAAQELTGARYAALGVLDENKSGLARFLTVGVDDETRRRIGPLPSGHGILGELIREPKPLRLEQIGDHPHSYGFPAGHPEMSTFLGVPITINEEVYGNLYLTEKAASARFDEEDEHLLTVLAEWAAVAIDNARSHERSRIRRQELERAVRGLEATAALHRELGGETDMGRVLELVVKRGRALIHGDSCVVFLLEGGLLRVGAAAGGASIEDYGAIAAADSPAYGPIRSGRSHVLTQRDVGAFAALGVEATSGLLVPLRSRGLDLGLLAVFQSIESASRSGYDDMLALESFATSASSAIYATRSVEDEKLRLSIASSERERQRWARELHDETLQELGALNVMLESAMQVDDGATALAALDRSNRQVERIIVGLQALIAELRPATLDELGIAAAVDALVERLRTRSGLAVELDIDLAQVAGERPTRYSPELEATIYRTVQEALNNVVKHAGASRVRILIEERNSEVAITVEDDGTGIGRAFDRSGGFGLVGMRERIELAGGKLAISDRESGGTRISAALPIEA